MFATYAFSATSPCCLGMKIRRLVEFIGVELASGAQLAAPVVKAMAGPVEKRRGGEGSVVESIVTALRCGEFFLRFLERLDEQIRCGCWVTSWPSIGTV